MTTLTGILLSAWAAICLLSSSTWKAKSSLAKVLGFEISLGIERGMFGIGVVGALGIESSSLVTGFVEVLGMGKAAVRLATRTVRRMSLGMRVLNCIFGVQLYEIDVWGCGVSFRNGRGNEI
jgi:hypothetical protein